MSIWMLHEPLTPDQEQRIAERTWLELPFEGMPNLAAVNNQAECKKLLQMLYPDAPPESIAAKLDHIWPRYSNLHPEDIIAIPLHGRKEIALAEISGRYRHRVSDTGGDIHEVPVRWHEKRVPFRLLSRHKEELTPPSASLAMREVENKQVRTLIRDRLPHSYNRFVGLKWLMVIFFLMHGIKYLHRLMQQH